MHELCGYLVATLRQVARVEGQHLGRGLHLGAYHHGQQWEPTFKVRGGIANRKAQQNACIPSISGGLDSGSTTEQLTRSSEGSGLGVRVAPGS